MLTVWSQSKILLAILISRNTSIQHFSQRLIICDAFTKMVWRGEVLTMTVMLLRIHLFCFSNILCWIVLLFILYLFYFKDIQHRTNLSGDEDEEDKICLTLESSKMASVRWVTMILHMTPWLLDINLIIGRLKSTTSSVHSSNTTRHGNSRLSEVCRRSGLTYGLTKLGLPYLIDRWYDDTLRSRISVQFYLLSGSSLHSLIDFRVYIDRKYLVITWTLSKNMIEPKEAFNYILNIEYNNLISQDNWPVKMVEKLL